jgi:hypothetical protein
MELMERVELRFFHAIVIFPKCWFGYILPVNYLVPSGSLVPFRREKWNRIVVNWWVYNACKVIQTSI